MKIYTAEDIIKIGITDYGARLIMRRVNEYNRQPGDITCCDMCNGRGMYMYVNSHGHEILKECDCMHNRYAGR